MPENDKYDYVISGGEAGKKRLNILSAVLEPYTSDLLKKAGLAAGASFLDNGCGGGNVSIMAAKMVGASGKVVATDIDDEILALARQDAEQEKLGNISFINKPAYELDYKREFDFAYARFLLSHLNHPGNALAKMTAAVKDGGRIIAEDIHFSGHFSYPRNKDFDTYLELYTEVVKRKGGNAEMGPALPALFKEAGIEDVSFDVVQPCFSKGDGKWMAYITLKRIKDALLSEKLINETELEALLDRLEAFTDDENTIISLPRIFRVWGTVRR